MAACHWLYDAPGLTDRPAPTVSLDLAPLCGDGWACRLLLSWLLVWLLGRSLGRSQTRLREGLAQVAFVDGPG